MAISKGLREAIVYIAVCSGIAAASALIWLLMFGGQFVHHFGVCLLIGGGLLSLTGGQLFTTFHMTDVNALMNFNLRSPSEEIPYGALTSVGVFLFVSIPLMAAGLAIMR